LQQAPLVREGQTTPTNPAWLQGARGLFAAKTAVLREKLVRLARRLTWADTRD